MLMATENAAALWRRLQPDFAFDGALRDLYVQATSLKDWRNFLHFLRCRQDVQYRLDGVDATLPCEVEGLFEPKDKLRLVQINLSGILLNCHCFSEEEIELDLDPREVEDATKFEQLLRFMRELAEALLKPVFLTYENMKNAVIHVVPPPNIRSDVCRPI
jgi:hypothetical protein